MGVKLPLSRGDFSPARLRVVENIPNTPGTCEDLSEIPAGPGFQQPKGSRAVARGYKTPSPGNPSEEDEAEGSGVVPAEDGECCCGHGGSKQPRACPGLGSHPSCTARPGTTPCQPLCQALGAACKSLGCGHCWAELDQGRSLQGHEGMCCGD